MDQKLLQRHHRGRPACLRKTFAVNRQAILPDSSTPSGHSRQLHCGAHRSKGNCPDQDLVHANTSKLLRWGGSTPTPSQFFPITTTSYRASSVIPILGQVTLTKTGTLRQIFQLFKQSPSRSCTITPVSRWGMFGALFAG